MNAVVKMNCRVNRIVSIATFVALGFASVAQAQVLGGGGNFGGGLGGALSGGSHSLDGSLTGGFGGSTEFGTRAIGTGRHVTERSLNRTQSKVDGARATASDKIDDTKSSAMRAKHVARDRVATAVDTAGSVANMSGGIAGDASSSAQANGANAAANGSGLAAGELNRGAIYRDPVPASTAHENGSETSNALGSTASAPDAATTPSVDTQVPQAKRRSLPQVDASGDATSAAHASRQGKMPRAEASAEASADANGSAKVSRK